MTNWKRKLFRALRSADFDFYRKGKHGFGTCIVKDLGFTLKSPGCSFFIFGKRVNSLDFLVLFVVVQIVVTVTGRGKYPIHKP